MKTISEDIEELFEEHKNLIKKTIWKNRPLLSALRIEDEDAAQQLSIALLSAIRGFDPNRSESLAAHISCSLQYEVLNIKRRHKPHGITGVPKDYRLNITYLDCGVYEPFINDDVSALEISELFEGLTEAETEAVDLKMQGYPIRHKTHTDALNGVRRRYTELYTVIC